MHRRVQSCQLYRRKRVDLNLCRHPKTQCSSLRCRLLLCECAMKALFWKIFGLPSSHAINLKKMFACSSASSRALCVCGSSDCRLGGSCDLDAREIGMRPRTATAVFKSKQPE